jgi:hypothetical protein
MDYGKHHLGFELGSVGEVSNFADNLHSLFILTMHQRVCTSGV